jgi:hypothetical protein
VVRFCNVMVSVTLPSNVSSWKWVIHGIPTYRTISDFQLVYCLYRYHLFFFFSVADPDPGSGAFLTPGSGIRNRFFPDLGSRIRNTVFYKLYLLLCFNSFFLYTFDLIFYDKETMLGTLPVPGVDQATPPGAAGHEQQPQAPAANFSKSYPFPRGSYRSA